MKTTAIRNALLTLGLAASLAASLGAAPALPTGTFTLDGAHSRVGFEVTHLVVATVAGKFDQAEATLKLDKDPAKSSVEATVQIASVNTDNEKRDGHLRGGDFFDAGKFPTMTFKSGKVALKGDRLTVGGTLTLKGVSRPVTFTGTYRGAVEDGWGNQKVGASLRTQINRQDFGVSWSKVIEAGPVVSDSVTIILDIEAGRPLAAKN